MRRALLQGDGASMLAADDRLETSVRPGAAAQRRPCVHSGRCSFALSTAHLHAEAPMPQPPCALDVGLSLAE